MLSMYIATVKLVIFGVTLKSLASCGSAAACKLEAGVGYTAFEIGDILRMSIALPNGAAAAANATNKVSSHFVFLEYAYGLVTSCIKVNRPSSPRRFSRDTVIRGPGVEDALDWIRCGVPVSSSGCSSIVSLESREWCDPSSLPF